jgi:hypothetical protein
MIRTIRESCYGRPIFVSNCVQADHGLRPRVKEVGDAGPLSRRFQLWMSVSSDGFRNEADWDSEPKGLGTGLKGQPLQTNQKSTRRCHFMHAMSRDRLIDDQPVQSYALDRVPELVEVDWFLDIAVSPQVVTGHQIPLFFRGGHNDDWDSPAQLGCTRWLPVPHQGSQEWRKGNFVELEQFQAPETQRAVREERPVTTLLSLPSLVGTDVRKCKEAAC